MFILLLLLLLQQLVGKQEAGTRPGILISNPFILIETKPIYPMHAHQHTWRNIELNNKHVDNVMYVDD